MIIMDFKRLILNIFSDEMMNSFVSFFAAFNYNIIFLIDNNVWLGNISQNNSITLEKSPM